MLCTLDTVIRVDFACERARCSCDYEALNSFYSTLLRCDFCLHIARQGLRIYLHIFDILFIIISIRFIFKYKQKYVIYRVS